MARNTRNLKNRRVPERGDNGGKRMVAPPQPVKEPRFVAPVRRSPIWLRTTIAVMLVAAVAVVFGQSLRNEFVNLDDDQYVTENPDVFTGLSLKNIGWAITSAHSANWHPLTWISHQVDCQIYGLKNPWGHHFSNLLLYAATVVLVFLQFERMTGAVWRSAAMTALFALHPLRAESVAWIAERKDMLSGLLFILTIWFYYDYARRPFSFLRYLLVICIFALGLTAKSMLVTVPCVLALLDIWPLRRIGVGGWSTVSRKIRDWELGIGDWKSDTRVLVRLILEKLPLFALSAYGCYMAHWSQSQVRAFKQLDFQFRVGNAIVSYAAYLGQTFWPLGLGLHYPHPGRNIHWQSVALASGIVLSITVFAVALAFFKRTYAAVGWFWYLGMLVPVIGLVQVGAQAHADRYTFLPHIGLFIAVVWLLADMAVHLPSRIRGVLFCVFLPFILSGLMADAWKQTSYWRSNMLLWQHSVDCMPNNDFAQDMLARLLFGAGDVDGAAEHYKKAIEFNERYPAPYVGLGKVYYSKGKLPEATRLCWAAIELDADNADAHNCYGVILAQLGKSDEAIGELQKAVHFEPWNAQALNNLGELCRRQGKFADAIEYCHQSLGIRSDSFEAHRNLGSALSDSGRLKEACDEFAEAVTLNPRDVYVRHLYGEALAWQGKLAEARIQFVAVANLGTGDTEERLKVARRLATDPRKEMRDGTAALRIMQDINAMTGNKNIYVLDVLAAAHAEQGDFAQAEKTVRAAIDIAQTANPQSVPILQNWITNYRAHVPMRLPSPEAPKTQSATKK